MARTPSNDSFFQSVYPKRLKF